MLLKSKLETLVCVQRFTNISLLEIVKWRMISLSSLLVFLIYINVHSDICALLHLSKLTFKENNTSYKLLMNFKDCHFFFENFNITQSYERPFTTRHFFHLHLYNIDSVNILMNILFIYVTHRMCLRA